MPDHGNLVAFDQAVPPRARSAYTWHAVSVSEEHAIRAIAIGAMEIRAPDGQPIRLAYVRHVEHPDGNWTWVGRPDGAKPGIEAIITFGDKAVFGSIPYGDHPALRLTTEAGRTWMVETDGARLAVLDSGGAHPRLPDAMLPPSSRWRAASGSVAAAQDIPATTANATASATNTVDVLLGYTATFAQRLGGRSQAVTRLTNMVDVANQAYANSQISATLRLVATVQVTYPDATSNQSALYELTGVTCTDSGCQGTTIPASLQPLHAARDQYGADLVSLVRNFSDPEQGGCGIAWIIGGKQARIDATNEYAGMSVISDTNGMGGASFPDNGYYCRDETLAHEFGHNMGSAHDRTTAAETDDSDNDGNLLDADEYGRYPYSFGYRTNGAGSFFTVMAYREAGSSQVQNRLFSNPQLSICGPAGAQVYPCGVASQADNARSLRDTIPIIVTFRASRTSRPMADFNGDGRSDVLWRNFSTGSNTIWRSGTATTQQAATPVASQAWQVAGIGDFDGDGAADIVWRNSVNGGDVVWRGASARAQSVLPAVAVSWSIVGIADFDGDGSDDIVWRNSANGANVLWRSANPRMQQALASVVDQSWRAVAVADFDGDGRGDIFWRNSRTGANVLWSAGNSRLQRALTQVADQNWNIAGAGDFDGDGSMDVLWRNRATGSNALWKSASSQQSQALAAVIDTHWSVAAIGDYDGDGRSDIFWRNGSSGANAIWRSANSTMQQAAATVADLAWHVTG
jgi:peptidyl-Asp metalloendopeptidase